MKIHGYGRPEDLNLDPETITEEIEELDEQGELLEVYEMSEEQNTGGSVLNMNGLTGRMFEFEKSFFVAWSCDEYIDMALFLKEN